MSDSEPIVSVVDDEKSVRTSLRRLLKSAGWNVETYSSAQEFLARGAADRPGCLVLDVSMPGLSGLELQEQMQAAGVTVPIVFITGHGDIPMSVKAMKAGAVDFLTKPFDADDLLRAIHQAVERDIAARRERAEIEAIRQRIESLTPREREVFVLVVSGNLNKQIAAQLGTCEKTVKVHRARVMRKMEAESLAELVQLAQRVGTANPPILD